MFISSENRCVCREERDVGRADGEREAGAVCEGGARAPHVRRGSWPHAPEYDAGRREARPQGRRARRGAGRSVGAAHEHDEAHVRRGRRHDEAHHRRGLDQEPRQERCRRRQPVLIASTGTGNDARGHLFCSRLRLSSVPAITFNSSHYRSLFTITSSSIAYTCLPLRALASSLFLHSWVHTCDD